MSIACEALWLFITMEFMFAGTQTGHTLWFNYHLLHQEWGIGMLLQFQCALCIHHTNLILWEYKIQEVLEGIFEDRILHHINSYVSILNKPSKSLNINYLNYFLPKLNIIIIIFHSIISLSYSLKRKKL